MHFLCKSLITSGLFFYKTLSSTILFSSTQHKSCTFASRSAMDEHRIWRDIAATWLVVWDGSEEKGVVCSPPRHLRRHQKTDECDKARNNPEYSWIQGCTQKNSQYSNTRMDCISARQRRNQLIEKDTKRLICDTCDSFYPIIYTYPHTGEVIEKNCHTVTCHNKTLNTLIINYYDTSNCLRAFVHAP